MLAVCWQFAASTRSGQTSREHWHLIPALGASAGVVVVSLSLSLARIANFPTTVSRDGHASGIGTR